MKRLYWNDPEPIEGNDYIITEIDGKEYNTFNEYYRENNLRFEELPEIVSIKYNGGLSEAEVMPSEIIEVDVEYYVWSTIEQRIEFPDGEEEYLDLDETTEKMGTYSTFEDAKGSQIDLSTYL